MRRALAAASIALLVASVLVVGAGPAVASAPSKDGWWNEANLGLGVNPIPPEVPSGGLYAANGYTGPVAYSALTFSAPPGAAIGDLTLQITGTPVITSPPVLCPLDASAAGYKAVQSGEWSDRPSYDCATAEITGTVSAGDKTVSFAAGSLAANGTLAVALLAGGKADQIAFAKPGADALAVTPAGTGASTSPPTAVVTVPSPSPATGTVPAVSGSAPAGASYTGGAGVPSAGTSPAVAPLASPAAATPVASGASTGTASSARGSAAPSRASSSPSPRRAKGGGSHTAGEVLGMVGLVGLLVAFSEGYGILGGRVRRRARTQPVVAVGSSGSRGGIAGR